MEDTALKKSDNICANMALEEKKLKSKEDDEAVTVVLAEINKEGDQEVKDQVMHVKQEDNNSRKRPSSTMKDLTLTHEDQIRKTKAKIGEVREENENLKQLLSKIVKDYHSLQKHFYKVIEEDEEAKKTTKILTSHQENEESNELISLSLGRRSSTEPKKEEKKSSNLSDDGNEDGDYVVNINKGLSLGLDCKFEPDTCSTMKINNNASSEDEEPKEEEPTEIKPPSKLLKTSISAYDKVLEPNQVKKARVSVRARIDTTTMNDGCQWRKYGQKIARGNPCPRAYYRCTVSPNCPVRKQVQRCVEDMSILITTYEGNHNHPLPLSATAMASTTSAAASMILSRSSTSESSSGIGTSSISAPPSISTPNGLNFTISQNARPQQQFYFPNSSISTSTLHPTITLDLTAPSTNYNNNNTSQYFNRFSTSTPPTSLNFSSSTSFYHSNNINTRQPLWNPYVEKQPTQENHQFYQPYMQMMNNQPHNQQSLTESIAAASKVITSNPTFRSALAAAITTFVGNNGGNNSGDHQSPAFNHSNGIGCASSYLNKSATSLSLNSPQQGNQLLLFPPSSFPFSSPNRASESPANSKDSNKI